MAGGSSDGGSTDILADNSLYYVLSKVLMTTEGENIADILSDIRKELQLMNHSMKLHTLTSKK